MSAPDSGADHDPSPDPGRDLDRADMLRLAGGRESALDDLMARHGGRLHGCLRRLLQNEAEAEDVAQETFVRVFEHRDRFDPERSFQTWLYAIAMNLVRDRFRWRSRHPESPLDAPASPGAEEPSSPASRLPDPARSPGESALAAERSAAVRTAVAGLPEDLRVPLVLAEFEERSQAEIGVILGCSAKAVEMKLYRARQHLRRQLAKWLES